MRSELISAKKNERKKGLEEAKNEGKGLKS